MGDVEADLPGPESAVNLVEPPAGRSGGKPIETSRWIVERSVDQIFLSLDGATKETFDGSGSEWCSRWERPYLE